MLKVLVPMMQWEYCFHGFAELCNSLSFWPRFSACSAEFETKKLRKSKKNVLSPVVVLKNVCFSVILKWI